MLAWIIRRVTGQPLAEVLSERIWRKLGAENDAYFMVDRIGTEAGRRVQEQGRESDGLLRSADDGRLRRPGPRGQPVSDIARIDSEPMVLLTPDELSQTFELDDVALGAGVPVAEQAALVSQAG